MKQSNSTIRTVPDPTLKEVTAPVTSFNDNLAKQIKLMVSTLRQEDGIGLAANQLGYDNRVLVIEFEEIGLPRGKAGKKNKIKERIPLTIVINPEVVSYSDSREYFEEGCLSVPNIELEIERPTQIKVKYQDEKGKKIKAAPKGLLARILQHEIDHLNGIIFTELAREQFLTNFPEFKKLKIAFFGSGEFGAIILEGLILLGFNLDIYTETAKPAGRDKLSRPTAVALVAKKFGKKYIEIEESPVPFKDTGPTISQREIGAYALGLASASRHHAARPARVTLKALGSSSLRCDLLLCSDFGQKIPNLILKQAKIAAINIHPSLLPKYLGPSPIQTAILNGDKTTGVSIIQMTEKIDEGPIYAQMETDILEKDTTTLLRDRLATLGLKLLVKILPKIAKNELELMPNDISKAVRTRKFTKSDGEIDWTKTSKKIDARIRAFSPWPGSYVMIDGKRLIIHSAHLKDEKLVLDIVQLEGKKPMKFSEFLRGYHGPKPEWINGSHV